MLADFFIVGNERYIFAVLTPLVYLTGGENGRKGRGTALWSGSLRGVVIAVRVANLPSLLYLASNLKN